MKMLLQDTRVDPTAIWNSAIRAAAYEGHLDIVKLLLQGSKLLTYGLTVPRQTC